MTFSELGLAEPLLKALASKNYETPTPIQAQAIPPLLEGRDLCGIAQTGTGKTAAFALPSLDYFHRNPKPVMRHGCRMLVLSPTRELAAQIADSFRTYARFMKISVATIFGGVPINRQIRQMQEGVDVLVATPGRLLDLIDQRAFTLSGVEIFVLDEADQMMDMGFIAPLKRIVKMLPKQRQNLFFSATMPKEIADLGNQFLHDPVKVSVAPQSTTAERVRQYVSFVDQGQKQALLNKIVRDPAIDRALVFTRTKHGADKVVRFLVGAGVEAVAIHGNKSQAQRTTALQAFRHGHVKFLVATDIAARGIDVSGVSHVINFELPNVAEQYVHRIGRTARAGADGIAISLVGADERPYLRAIERLTRQKCEVVPLPENFDDLVRELPKPAPVQRGPRPNKGGGGGRGGAERAHRGENRRGQGQDAAPRQGEGRQRAEGGEGAGRPSGGRRRRKPVGAHKDAVRKFRG
ncbi:ATP-dependent RNA helicase RhlE [Sphingobium jiangsuense]|uniref:DEAD-box ATP-dependent RNA helicase RhpA n=2 Tax=Sphingobium jiangsuense TaxID=870476 RepID=A0A7W6BJG5_9SPHN|nr:DEAD/DEAH box helicase [Sphingobium jiangsuense]MBB3928171.1 ATP-dependent RNA helicase RhlE [Sphingobium jiangsuense]